MNVEWSGVFRGSCALAAVCLPIFGGALWTSTSEFPALILENQPQPLAVWVFVCYLISELSWVEFCCCFVRARQKSTTQFETSTKPFKLLFAFVLPCLTWQAGASTSYQGLLPNPLLGTGLQNPPWELLRKVRYKIWTISWRNSWSDHQFRECIYLLVTLLDHLRYAHILHIQISH